MATALAAIPSTRDSIAGTEHGATVSSGFPARQPLGGVPRSSGKVRVVSRLAQYFIIPVEALFHSTLAPYGGEVR